MYAKHLRPYIIKENDSIYKAFWKLSYNEKDALFVINSDENIVGVCTKAELNKANRSDNPDSLIVKDIMNQQFKCCSEGRGTDVYKDAAYNFSLFPSVGTLPVLSEDKKDIIDVMTRERVFYTEYYNKGKLPRMHYARCMYNVVNCAKRLGYKKISVIEFGVAGGNGLSICEFHAKEMERLYDIEIEIYGFDSGEGLPDNCDVRNLPYSWYHGRHKMNRKALEDRLTKSKLIIGDICETCVDFLEKYEPAPIGVMLVDVDYYTSTVPVLEMLNSDRKYFLPRVLAYFDDIRPNNEELGENLAVREFNAKSKNIRISPEGSGSNTKMIHILDHPDYSKPVLGIQDGANLDLLGSNI